ncbi:MAG: MBL fold metallo-hydrolase [Clostridia bacterium]|nr:MBL fold metallo-hydrolase [Clostridia bacterium]
MTRFYQLETDFRYVNCGMCYVLRLESGELIVLDGGYFAPGQAEALNAFFRELCPKGIRIRAWMFSHAHQDHIGAFINYVRLFPDTPIGRIYHAFQPMDFSGVTGDWKDSDPATFREFYTALKEMGEKADVHVFETGEVIDIDEARFEVLYTYRDAEEEITNFNDNSAVLMLSCRGTRILLPGDAAAVGAKALMKRPDKLKCDIVQLSHHGFFGLPEEVYAAAGAHTSLWPTPFYEVEKNAARQANAFLARTTDVILSNRGTACLELPYAKGTYTLLPRMFPDKAEADG